MFSSALDSSPDQKLLSSLCWVYVLLELRADWACGNNAVAVAAACRTWKALLMEEMVGQRRQRAQGFECLL